MWRDVLKHAAIRPDSSFFEVGGTSLSVFAVVHRLRAAFGLDRRQLSDQALYQFPTVEALAAHIDGLQRGTASPAPAGNTILVTLKSGEDPSLPPFFVIASAGGTLGAYEKLARVLKTRREIVGVRDPFIWGERDATMGFDHWVALYVSAIQQRQPEGPYYIGAYSSAGAFGYEIARQLRRDGRDVRLLALIDPLGMDSLVKQGFGYWALRARYMRPSFRRIVRLGRMAASGWPSECCRHRGPSDGARERAAEQGRVPAPRDAGQDGQGPHPRPLGAAGAEHRSSVHPRRAGPLEGAARISICPCCWRGSKPSHRTSIRPRSRTSWSSTIVQTRSQHAYRLQRYKGNVAALRGRGSVPGAGRRPAAAVCDAGCERSACRWVPNRSGRARWPSVFPGRCVRTT